MITIEENPSCFFTQQVFLIGTRNEDGAANFAPISWISYTYGPPTCLLISMGMAKQTFRNIERTGVLSATVLTPDLLPFAECCNNHTKNETLYERVKPPFENGQTLDVPLITGAKWTYECEVIHTVKLSESATFFAKIKQVHLAPEVAALDFYDLRAINPVVYSPNNYFTIGEHLGEIGDYSMKDRK